MKKSFFILLTFLLFSHCYGQQQLSSVNSSWNYVLPGKVIYAPQSYSKGFGIITDAKNLMFFSNKGKLLWEKHLLKCNSPFFTVLPQDFILVVTDNGKKITFLNADGQELWSKISDYQLQPDILPGKDGRFFIRGNNQITALSIYGNEKWNLETPQQNSIKLQELSDGSIILFLQELEENKSKALRITPFGEVIEQITFAGEVVNAVSVPSGILLTFTDGNSGLFDINENTDRAEHKWLFQKNRDTKVNNAQFLLSQNKKDVIFLNPLVNNMEINYMDMETGNITKTFFAPNIQKLIFCDYNDSGVLLCDVENAYFYNNSGKLVWSGKMPQKGARDFANNFLFTKDNHFLLFCTNWSINAFRTNQSANKKNQSKIKTKNLAYSSYYKLQEMEKSIQSQFFINPAVIDDKRYNEVSGKKLGKQEAEYFSELYCWCNWYRQSLDVSNSGARVEKNLFETDTIGVEKLLRQLPLYETTNSNDLISYFLKKENNKTLVYALLLDITENYYDPDYQMLQAIEIVLTKKFANDELITKAVCDAVYEICHFHGIDAINSYGKQILTEMMYPQFTYNTRNYARDTIKRLVNPSNPKKTIDNS